jgi:HEAT repeat protein
MISRRAAFVLGSVGERAIPILRTALADTNQVGRTVIVFAVRQIALNGHTNACLPIIMGALNDGDVLVRDMATNGIRQIAPEMLPTGESSNLESQQ